MASYKKFNYYISNILCWWSAMKNVTNRGARNKFRLILHRFRIRIIRPKTVKGIQIKCGKQHSVIPYGFSKTAFERRTSKILKTVKIWTHTADYLVFVQRLVATEITGFSGIINSPDLDFRYDFRLFFATNFRQELYQWNSFLAKTNIHSAANQFFFCLCAARKSSVREYREAFVKNSFYFISIRFFILIFLRSLIWWCFF